MLPAAEATEGISLLLGFWSQQCPKNKVPNPERCVSCWLPPRHLFLPYPPPTSTELAPASLLGSPLDPREYREPPVLGSHHSQHLVPALSIPVLTQVRAGWRSITESAHWTNAMVVRGGQGHGKSVVFRVGRPMFWLYHLWGRIFGGRGPSDSPTLSASPPWWPQWTWPCRALSWVRQPWESLYSRCPSGAV